MLHTKLKNGLDLIVRENHAAPVAAIQVWVRVGSADEREGEFGLAHVHEHMLFKGTEERGVGEIASGIEGAGGEINAWTSYDETVYHVTMASRDFEVGLDTLADAVQHSVFDEEELGKELEVVLEEIRRGNDMPSRVMAHALFAQAFQKHPYSRPVIGYVDTVKAFDRKGILEFYRRWYQPKNMTLVVVGDVDADQVAKKAETIFTRADAPDESPVETRVAEPTQETLRTVVQFQDVQETHLGMAFPGVAFRHPDTPVLDVLSVLLGSGDSSRLYTNVKRDRQVVNECYAHNYTPKDQGLMMVGATIHGDTVTEAIEALLSEAFALRHEAPSVEEVEKAKTILLSDAVYQKETVQGIARKIGFFEVIAGGSDYEDTYYDAIRKVDPESVRAAAEKYFPANRCTISVLAPDAQKDAVDQAKIEAAVRKADEATRAKFAPLSVELGAAGVAKLKLSCGATLLVREDESVPLVSMRVSATGGLLAETAQDNGVSHMTAELLVRGTKRFSAEQIAEQLDSMASGIRGVSGRNSLGMSGTFLREHWDRGFDIFASCLLESTFDEAELELERKTQLEDIAGRKDSLSACAFDLFTQNLWQSHPYRMTDVGTDESVSALTREQVVKTYEQQLRPDRLTIAVVGAVDVNDTVRMFERRFAGAPSTGADWVMPPIEAPPESPRSGHLKKEKEQAHLVLGFPGVSMKDERRWALDVLSTVLAGQGGRLFMELRDRQSLAYSVTAFSLEGLAPGYFATYIGTAQDKLETAERGLRSELQKVLDADIDPQELERAKRYLIGTHEIALQRAGSRAGTMALNETYGLGYDDYTRYAARIEAVTSGFVRDTAKEIIRFDRLVRSVVAAT